MMCEPQRKKKSVTKIIKENETKMWLFLVISHGHKETEFAWGFENVKDTSWKHAPHIKERSGFAFVLFLKA